MKLVKRDVIIDIAELCVTVPEQYKEGFGTLCRQVLLNEVVDPGIGAMIVNPTSDPSYFRVR